MTLLLGASRPGLEPELPRRALRMLFVKQQLGWPRSRGHDVHGYHMMRALARLGHSIILLTGQPPAEEALEGLPLAQRLTFKDVPATPSHEPLTLWQKRYMSYWGTDPRQVDVVARTAAEQGADVVVGVGTETLPYLARVQKAYRVWYAADDPVWTQLSGVRLGRPRSWGGLVHAVASSFYVRSFAGTVDSTWVVSDMDRRWLRGCSGLRRVEVVANGVDSEFFQPGEAVAEVPDSCVFWGRLDFGPNLDALEWFCQHVWPTLRQERPQAELAVIGFNPGEKARRLTQQAGVALLADLPDLRAEVCRRQVVVLPFVSGGGIKNKLLEAAALGRPIVCTPRACNGLRQPLPPLPRSDQPAQWSQEILALWDNPERRAQLGQAAGQWVREHHDWSTTAREAIAALERGMGDS